MVVGLEQEARAIRVQKQTVQRSYDLENQCWLNPFSRMTDEMDGLASAKAYSSKSFSGYTHGRSILPQKAR